MANALRALAMDAVEAAKSGHPGMPMGMADVATVLFSRHLKFSASHPDWPDRDRFILSAGHGSMLLYGLLYLTGFPEMDIGEIKRFRQLDSKTPGHPEYGAAPGIETTTGPLGQGLGNAVGMAIAEAHLRAVFGPEIVDHRTYVIAGDGCLMEGISHEAIALAGHLRLNRLIVLFDDNSISIDGPTSLAVSDDVRARFAASGWATDAVDGHDAEAVDAAIARAKQSDRPSLIACRTTIAYGAPTKQGTAAAHGSPLGPAEITSTRVRLGWPSPPFEIPPPNLAAWRSVGRRGDPIHDAWKRRLAAQPAATRAEFSRRIAGELPPSSASAIAEAKSEFAALHAKQEKLATRRASQLVLERITAAIPELLGGSADLTGSNLTQTKNLTAITAANFAGRYLFYGVREHGMGAAMNGIALHGGVIPYGGTFLVFTDYMRPSMRLAALMGLRVIYVMTHDSIGLGEDGPTHQPVEHLAALRAIPNLLVLRPADGVETAECWAIALSERRRPSVLALTRQNVAPLRTSADAENRAARGAYEIAPAQGPAKVTLLATGSEVAIAFTAKQRLDAEGIAARVVSVPSHELFAAQDEAYRTAVLGPGTVKVAIEAGIRMAWDRFIGADGSFVGMVGFGASAPYETLYQHFGITPDAVVTEAKLGLARSG
ncbi:MAG: transketolase [Alphaproteobacteria bacterium]|nr:transketolase [Alphaproteobacteria bacterium]